MSPIGGLYVYLYFETRGSPPPLTLDKVPVDAAARGPNGIWVTNDGSRLTILGGWIESEHFASGKVLPLPIDLTDLKKSVPLVLHLPNGSIKVLWRAQSLQLNDDGVVIQLARRR